MDTTFQPGTVITHEWLNDVNSHVNNKDAVEHSADKIGFIQGTGGTPATGAVQRTVRDELRERISVTQYGADPTGVADSTAAIQAALTYLASLGGGTLTIPKGSYLVTDTLSYTGSNLTIIADGAVINHTSAQNTTLDIAGGQTSFTTNGAIAIGATSIPMVSTTGISVGDVVYLVAAAGDTLWCKERSYFYRGEFCEVTAVAAGSITIASPMIDAYITGATVWKLNNKNLKISGLEIRRSNNLACLTVSYLSNVVIENCKITGANERCFYTNFCYNVAINDCEAFGSYFIGTGTSYGLCIGSCQNVNVTGGSYRAGRHGITTGGTIPCRFLTFDGCITDTDPSAAILLWAFDFHSNIQYATVTNVVSKNGMGLSGVNITVGDCVSIGNSNHPFLFLAVKDSANTLNVSNLNLTNNQANSAFALSTVGDGTSYDISVGDINISGLNVVQNVALSGNPAIHFAGSAENKVIYNNLNISGLQAVSAVAQNPARYGLAIAGNSSTLNASAIINITNAYIDCKCRSFGVLFGNVSAKVNIANSVFKSVAPSDYAARLGLATFNISDTIFDGSSNSLYVECTGGSVTFSNCTFEGMTSRAFYGNNLTYAAAFNCKNNTGVAFYAQVGTSPALVIGINSATGARIATAPSIPTAGTWAVGDIAYHTAPAAAGFIGWVCTTAGTPGTWKTFGAISA